MDTELFNSTYVLSILPQGVIITDNTDRIIYANPEAQRICETNSEQAVGISIFKALGWLSQNQSFGAEPLTIYVNKTVVKVQKLQYKTVQVDSSPSLFIYVLFPQEEITRELHTLLNTISLEVRGPLSIIRGCVDILLRGTVGAINEDQQEFLSTIKAHTGSVANAFNQMLLFANIETGLMACQPSVFDVRQTIKDVVKRNTVFLNEKRIQLTQTGIDNLGTVHADEDHVRHILHQILDNAIYFSNMEQEITIFGRQDHDNILIIITDNGIGIQAEAQPFIFDRNYYIQRSTPLTVHRVSLRLGLYIAKKLASDRKSVV